MPPRVKAGVQFARLSPQILFADIVIFAVYAAHGLECELTSGTDGAHMAGSKHYGGHGHDYGVRAIPEATLVRLVVEIDERLRGAGYDVLYEGPVKPAGLPDRLYWRANVPHLHVEFDPKDYAPA